MRFDFEARGFPRYWHGGSAFKSLFWTQLSTAFEPGEKFVYCNFGYCLLGRIIEKMMGQHYDDAVRHLVLQSCGVTDMEIAGNTLAQRRRGEVKYYGQGDNPYDMNVTRMDSHGGWIARPSFHCR